MKSNCLIIAGEKSGEEHCLTFLDDLKRRCPHIDFWGVGGQEMQKIGFESLYDLKDFSSWGFSEVIGKIPFYYQALKKIEEEVVKRETNVAILIDFQDFNLRLAKRLKKKGVQVLYYVAPQAWVWKPWRAKVLEETVHTLFTILPFEKNWFKERGVKRVVGVDHPLHRSLGELVKELPQKKFSNFQTKTRLVLLPGSRNFEVQLLLPEFIKACQLLNREFSLELSLVKSPNVQEELYAPYLPYFQTIYSSEELPTALKKADFALAASGTVTLATALFEVPTVVCYKSSLLNEYIYYTFLDYSGPVSLANIVHDQWTFPELIQNQATAYNMVRELLKWMTSEEEYIKIKNVLSQTKSLIQGDSRPTSEIMAEVIDQSSNAL